MRNPFEFSLLTLSLMMGPGSPLAFSQSRLPWVSSRLHGTPDPPPPYQVELAFPHLKFQQPVEVAGAPGLDRLFVAELNGKVFSFPNHPACAQADLSLELPKFEGATPIIYGLEFHPQFEKNRFVYLCYVTRNELPDGTRVSRFEVSREEPPRIDLRSETVIITWLSGGHNGGCLKFGKEGCLYISTGDAVGPSPPDTKETGQDIGDLLSSILRIDVERRENGRNYAIPEDNPFRNVSGACPEIWAYGFRNPWKMGIDPDTGDLWIGDVGWEMWELVDRVQRGGNYGWSITEGRQRVRSEGKIGPTPILPPTVEHPHSEAASITGGLFYRGRKLPELAGAYIYGDWVTGKIWGLRAKGGQVAWHRELVDTPLHIVGFGEDSARELYILDYDITGQLYRLVPNPEEDESRSFPRRLSETGLFASTVDLDPAPGVIPYSINAEMWADRAFGQRWLAVPDGRAIDPGDPLAWKFPEGTVLVKTFFLELEQGNPASRRRIETQLLHFEKNDWRPYSYVWNDEGSDAALAEARGLKLDLKISAGGAPGGVREETWSISSRAECSHCHNPWAGTVLGLNTYQLNKPQSAAGAPENQLDRWQRLGIFHPPLPQPADQLPRLDNPHDPAAGLEERARAYLHVNCAHCHRFGGGTTSTLQLQRNVLLKDAAAAGVRPLLGSFGIEGAALIAPGDPFGSVVYYRMAKLGSGRMPRLSAREVDARGLELIGDWIAGLPGGSGGGAGSTVKPEDEAALKILITTHPANDNLTVNETLQGPAAIHLLSSTRGALALLKLLDTASLPDALRQQVLQLAADHPNPEARDLFERFIPASRRKKRLGSDLDPMAILALSGSSERGRQVFLKNSAAQCKNCHAIQGTGGTIGPDLSRIGAKYQRPALLQHLIEPSREIAPEYAAYLLGTRGGEMLSGVLVRETDQEVVLKDVGSQLHAVPRRQVKLLVRQEKSLMPEQLLSDLTAQEAADLLEFLATLK
ncbi:MAG: PQQ-dependent sugar dehydrogenase [Planctomycetes bacterium]|nr:PQQ-dependent sugar dehydrogenase [Planctomycetota bacterium]